MLATRLDGTPKGAKLLLLRDETLGDLGDPSLNHAVAAEGRALLDLGETALRTFGDEGQPAGGDVRVFIQAFAPKPQMYIFGALDFSRAMATMGAYLGYHVTVVDARPAFATKARIPDAHDVVAMWPDEFLRTATLTAQTTIIVLTHDEKFDLPVLELALQSPAGYIGAMGSRATHANRLERLRERGVPEAQLARICAPIGLDLGARTPEETAVSIAAEIIALRYGRSGGRLANGTEKIHVERLTPALASGFARPE